MREAGAGIEIARRIHAEHLTRATPVLVVAFGVLRLTDVLREERAGIVLIVAAIDDGIGQLHELVFKFEVVAFLPHILEHHVDIHLVDAEAIEMQHAFSDIGDVRRGNGDLGAAARELLQPKWNVLHHILIATAFRWFCQAVVISHRLFPHAVQIMLFFRPIDGDADGKVVAVFLDEILDGLLMVVNAVGGEREAVAIEPMVITTVQLDLDVVANLVNKFYLQERLAADEVPHHRLVCEIGVGLMVKHIVDEGLGYFPRHPLLHVLAHKVTILTSQLAVLGDNEGDVFRHATLPRSFVVFNINH